jgi:hypothetical protein
MTVNKYAGNYNHVYIYNNDGVILFQTANPDNLNFNLTINIRHARKLILNKQDCFDIKTSDDGFSMFRNGKDLYIHNSIVDVVKVEEVVALQASGAIAYHDVYTLRLQDGTQRMVKSDYYTRTEKTNERLYREKLAGIISECLFSGKHVSHYEVEEMLKRLEITIKE